MTASRQHLTERYAAGVDRLIWEQDKRVMPDVAAVKAMVSAASAGEADVLDIGAALVTLQAVRLETDLLEADVLDAAESGAVAAESVAAVLGLPDADAVDARHRMLTSRRELPLALAGQVPPDAKPPKPLREAAERAGHRARQAADRASAARRRREQLSRAQASQGTSAAPAMRRELVDEASAYASEARVSAKEAAERVAMGLLRAAEALDRCAARCGEWESMPRPGTSRPQLRRRAREYADAARLYREMADWYRDIGGEIP